MDQTPLPNDPLDSEISDQDTVSLPSLSEESGYVIRITPDENTFTLENVINEYLKEYHYWVIGIEKSPKLHFHIVIQTLQKQDQVRDSLRTFLFKYYPVRGRGWGNKQYNLQETVTLFKAISYAIKEKEYYYQGFTEELIQELLSKSFSKNKRSDFKSDLIDLEERFVTEMWDLRTYMVKFVQLKAKYKQLVNIHYAYQYALSAEIRRDPSVAEEEVEKYLYKQ